MAQIKSKLVSDFIGGFLGGVDSGVEAHLLPRNKLGWMINGTVRGGYVSPRPKIINYNFSDGGILIIGGSQSCSNFVQNGFFQGATPKAYQPNTSSVLPGSTFFALISGRLFGFTSDFSLSNSGAYIASPGSIALKEFTINNAGTPDLNSISAPQAWLDQAENYLIVQDGVTANPLVFDGNTSFRSNSAQTQIAVFNSKSANVAPNTGQILSVDSSNFSTAPTTTTPQPVSVYSSSTGAYLGQMSIGFPPSGFYNALLNTVGTHTFNIGDTVYLQNSSYPISNQTLNISASYPFPYANNLVIST